MGRGSSWQRLPYPSACLAVVLAFGLAGLASAAGISPARTIRPATLPKGVVGIAYAEPLVAVGRLKPTTLRVTRGKVPPGLVLTGAGLMRGRPSASGVWSFTVTSFARGGSTAGSRAYRLAIAAAPNAVRSRRPVIAPPSLAAAQLDEEYTGQLIVRGPSPPYSIRVTRGRLPPGLTVSSSGRVSGMPSEPGTFAFTVSAFSRGKYVTFRDYTLAVEGVVPSPYFTDDFENGLGQWNKEGAPPAFGIVKGFSGQGASISAGPSTTGASNGVSEIAALWLDFPVAYASSGKSTWYAIRVWFPDSYEATTGQWNWFIEWHIDSATAQYANTVSPALGVFTDFPVGPTRGRNPRLAFRLKGGPVGDQRTYLFTTPPNSLARERWYDLRIHFVWSPSSELGRAELWIDGRRRVDVSFPTLYTLPNGTASFGYFGLYNYRLKASWDSSIHFDRVRIGPTLSSVR